MFSCNPLRIILLFDDIVTGVSVDGSGVCSLVMVSITYCQEVTLSSYSWNDSDAELDVISVILSESGTLHAYSIDKSSMNTLVCELLPDAVIIFKGDGVPAVGKSKVRV